MTFMFGWAFGVLTVAVVTKLAYWLGKHQRSERPLPKVHPGINHPIASLADEILAGNRNWAEPTMDMEVGAAVRAQTAALAVAIKHIRDKQQ